MIAVHPRIAGLVLFLLLIAGCDLKHDSVTWLPDSSGFVYTAGKGTQLHLYDVGKRASRSLVAGLDGRTPCPAVSPDGRQIAVACVRVKGNAGTIQVLRYDLTGKEQHRSRVLSWNNDEVEPTEVKDADLCWSPDGRKLLIVCPELGTAVYDLKKDSIKPLRGLIPLVIAGSPFLPDSNDFLACRWSGREPRQVLICDADGFETNIERKQKLSAEEREKLHRLLLYAPFYTTEWEGSTAVVSRYTAVLRLDTGKKTLSFDDAGRPVPEGEAAPWRQHVFKTNLGLRLLPVENGSDYYRLEVIKVSDKRVKYRRFRSGLESPLVMVAPSKKHLAVRYKDSGNKDVIVVFDDEAEVVDEIGVDMSR
jgi:hypothetical protein